MIPKIIHQIWFQGKSECPHLDNCKTWREKNPKYEYIFWDEPMMKELVQSKYLYLYDKWNNYNYIHQKIDMFKYILMDYYGGIYADVDSVCLKSFDSLVNQYDGIVVSSLSSNSVESWVTFGTTEPVNNGVILSKRGHPFWKLYIDKILNQKGPWITKFNEINSTTGPSFFSKCVNEYKSDNLNNDIIILDHTYFEPCFSGDSYCKVGKNSYVDHQHSQTWINPVMQFLTKLYYKAKHYFPAIIILIIFYYFIWLERNKGIFSVPK